MTPCKFQYQKEVDLASADIVYWVFAMFEFSWLCFRFWDFLGYVVLYCRDLDCWGRSGSMKDS